MTSLYDVRPGDVNLSSAAQFREYEAVADRIARDRPASVLDWGCGWGQVSHLLKERGVEVAAFDFRPGEEPEGLRALDRFPDVEAYIASEDPRRLPYDDGSFAAVLSCGVLEHVQDPDSSLEELKRVLRPGGTLYVYKLPNRRSYLEWIARRIGWYYHGAGEFDQVYTLDSARDLLARHGYAVREIRYANMLPLTMGGRVMTWLAPAIWGVSRVLSRVPGLNRLATNVELIATAP